ncbi:hypothetical protein BS47DRAFT_1368240 [Hydnum rufescens UP504]|uniref:Uncharacterized protein n=1 Tax=Hydnum rufescens UP504 TaxID=1448309 RepID=A0A9P6DIC6_9AGAM|nr:hypothetical protein BS47DRAFT_1368240 [Hydnum rufescens UP504]
MADFGRHHLETQANDHAPTAAGVVIQGHGIASNETPPNEIRSARGPSGNMRNETEPNENTRGAMHRHSATRTAHPLQQVLPEMKTAKATNDDAPNEDTRRCHNPYEPHTCYGGVWFYRRLSPDMKDSPNEPPPRVEMTTPHQTKTPKYDQPRNTHQTNRGTPRRTTPASAGVWQSQGCHLNP